MTVVRELLISFGAQLDDGSVKKVDSKVNALAGGIETVLGAAFLAGIGRGFFALNEMASDVEETMNVINQSFADNADEVVAWSEKYGDAAGRSQYELQATAATLGAVLNPMLEQNAEAAAEMSMGLAELTVDLGSFYNMADSGVLNALRAGLTGEAEPLKRLGIVMTEDTLKAYALSQGINKSVKSMSVAEKTTLRYNYILEQTTNAQGDAIRTAEGWANAKKAVIGKLQELATAVGLKVLPFMSRLAVMAKSLVGGFTQFVKGTKLLESALVVLGAVALKVAIGMLIAFAPVIIPLLKLAAIMTLLALAVDDFLVFLDGGDSVLGRFIDSMFGPGSATAAAEALKQAWSDLQHLWAFVIVPALNEMRVAIGEFIDFAKPYFEGLIAVLGAGFQIVIDLWKTFFDFLVSVGIPAIGDFASAVWESTEDVRKFFKEMFDDIWGWLNESDEMLKNFSDTVLGTVRSVGKLLGINTDIALSTERGSMRKQPGHDPGEGPSRGSAGGVSNFVEEQAPEPTTFQKAAARLFKPKDPAYAPEVKAPSFNIQSAFGGEKSGGGDITTGPTTVNVAVSGNASVETADRVGVAAAEGTNKANRRTLAALKQRKRK